MLAVCEARDVKGLYAKARAGEITAFTGVSDPYEPPVNPELEILTGEEEVKGSAEKVVKYLVDHGFIANPTVK